MLPNKRLRDESDFRTKATPVTEKLSLSHYLEEKMILVSTHDGDVDVKIKITEYIKIGET